VIHYLKKNILKIILKNYYFILFLFFINESHANLTRSTTFDERPKCESSKGMWRDFGNSCADKCEYKFQKYPYCSNAIIYSCDCGKNRCLYQDQCIEIQDYLAIHQKNEIEEQKILEETKEIRLQKAKKFKREYMNKFVDMYNHDPNYRDPYYHQREKPLPPNTFKNNNRMLIYNNIVKQQNDKINLQKKLFEEQLKTLESAKNIDKNAQLEINKIKDELAKIDSIKILQPITENIEENKNKIKDISNDISQKKQQIVDPIKESGEKIIDSASDNGSIISESDFLKKINNMLEKKNENSNKVSDIDKSVENNSLINDYKEMSKKIPPVYVKSQNGDADFNNREVIDNSINFPQFSN